MLNESGQGDSALTWRDAESWPVTLREQPDGTLPCGGSCVAAPTSAADARFSRSGFPQLYLTALLSHLQSSTD